MIQSEGSAGLAFSRGFPSGFGNASGFGGGPCLSRAPGRWLGRLTSMGLLPHLATRLFARNGPHLLGCEIAEIQKRAEHLPPGILHGLDVRVYRHLGRCRGLVRLRNSDEVRYLASEGLLVSPGGVAFDQLIRRTIYVHFNISPNRSAVFLSRRLVRGDGGNEHRNVVATEDLSQKP